MSTNFFDVIGPVMIGPSSSHTAGAARIGLAVNRILKGCVKKADITLYNSFAETGKGHGTDKALIGGILGFGADDSRLPDSFEYAHEAGLEFAFKMKSNSSYHPNTVTIKAENEERSVKVRASSVGGGSIRLNTVDQFALDVSGDLDIILVAHYDRPGVLADITTAMEEMSINIAEMHVSRERKGGEAVTVLEVDNGVTDEVREKIMSLDIVEDFLFIPKIL